ncbi:bacteriohopanetetrol glucosamine biosynthesis glycosyltransferase HpnI [Microvirga sp. 2TAF3]|uniref:bacteriohopanetetrol glucosamine biosynthesis glycosyltransferase HpnI n=1 Tax=Microvirga sp. 2TAF3 TaxID=3233014 RepID=UPI003F9E452B
MLSWLIIICLIAAGLGCLHMIVAAVLVGRFVRRKTAVRNDSPSVTILKPLCGNEPRLMENLVSFCVQDYSGPVQVIFGVQDPADPAIAIVERLAAQLPERTVELVVNPRRHGANRKVSNLVNMAAHIRHETVLLADSDMRVGPDYLAGIIAELGRPSVDGVTCLYYGLASQSVWSRLSALGIDTHFLPNVVVGLALGLARPCFGSTVALKRETLDRIGGFEAFADTLADDYMLGMALRSKGREVAIPPFVIGHACNERSWRELWRHELRWTRTIRSVDPVGYAGLAITYGLPWALIAGLLGGGTASLTAAVLAVGCRISLCIRIERAFDLMPHPYWLVPLRDLLSFAVFVASFAGQSVTWKGHRYRLKADGTLS